MARLNCGQALRSDEHSHAGSAHLRSWRTRDHCSQVPTSLLEKDMAPGVRGYVYNITENLCAAVAAHDPASVELHGGGFGAGEGRPEQEAASITGMLPVRDYVRNGSSPFREFVDLRKSDAAKAGLLHFACEDGFVTPSVADAIGPIAAAVPRQFGPDTKLAIVRSWRPPFCCGAKRSQSPRFTTKAALWTSR